MKNDGQPIIDSVPWNSRCTKDHRWLNNAFPFSAEIWAEQLEKTLCVCLHFFMYFISHICILCAAGDEEQHDQPERLLQEGHVLSDGGNWVLTRWTWIVMAHFQNLISVKNLVSLILCSWTITEDWRVRASPFLFGLIGASACENTHYILL